MAERHGGSQATSDDYTAAVAAFLFFLGVENGEDGFIKNSFETLLSQGRAFQVALRSYRFRQLHTVLIGEGLLLHVQQTSQGFGVISEINLGPNEHVRHVRHAVLQLRDPLLLNIVVRGRVHDREADEKHVGVGVREGPQLVVVLLWEGQRRVSAGCGRRVCASSWDSRMERLQSQLMSWSQIAHFKST